MLALLTLFEKDDFFCLTENVLCSFRFENKSDNLSRNVKVWFDRRDAYLFGVCLENVNLALFFSNFSHVRIFILLIYPLIKFYVKYMLQAQKASKLIKTGWLHS